MIPSEPENYTDDTHDDTYTEYPQKIEAHRSLAILAHEGVRHPISYTFTQEQPPQSSDDE
jgi:hypothetical protein